VKNFEALRAKDRVPKRKIDPKILKTIRDVKPQKEKDRIKAKRRKQYARRTKKEQKQEKLVSSTIQLVLLMMMINDQQ